MGFTNLSYANLPFMGCLPTMITNFGGDTQVTIPNMQPYTPLGIYLNPQAQGMLSGGYYNSFGMEQAWAKAQENAHNMTQDFFSKLASNKMNNSYVGINTTKLKLESMQDDKDTKAEEKAKIKELLTKLDEEKKKLDDLKENKNEQYTPQGAYETAANIEEKIREIANEVASLSAASNAGQKGKSGGVTKSEKKDGAKPEVAPKKDPDAKPPVKGEEKPVAKSEEQPKEVFSEGAKVVAENIYNATKGFGTDDKALRENLELIDKDNVMDIMLAWNKDQSDWDNETLMEAIMSDADHSDKEKYGKQIFGALKGKAEELGLEDDPELRKAFKVLHDELYDHWLYIDNDKVAKATDEIVKRLAKEMGSKYGQKASLRDATSTESSSSSVASSSSVSSSSESSSSSAGSSSSVSSSSEASSSSMSSSSSSSSSSLS